MNNIWNFLCNSFMQIIVDNLLEEEQKAKCDLEYFSDLVFGVTENLGKIDDLITSKLGDSRKIDELTPVELAVLRIATYEFLFKIGIVLT